MEECLGNLFEVNIVAVLFDDASGTEITHFSLKYSYSPSCHSKDINLSSNHKLRYFLIFSQHLSIY